MSDFDRFNEAGSWSKAKQMLRLLGPIPSSVGNAAKNLWSDHLTSLANGKLEVSYGSSSAVRLVDKSSVLKMPLFFAAQSLYPERFKEIQEDDTSKALIRILHPGLFASLLSLIYLHRRFSKICNPEQWEGLTKEFVVNMELGFLIGKGCPRIGEAVGTLVGGIRYAALALLLRNDPEGYIGYRNLMKTFEVEFEHERWGCDHGQLAALILKSLRISSEQTMMTTALRGCSPQSVTGDYLPWRAAVLLIEGIKQEIPMSEIDLSECRISLSEDEQKRISSEIATLFSEGSTFTWMLKGNRDD